MIWWVWMSVRTCMWFAKRKKRNNLLSFGLWLWLVFCIITKDIKSFSLFSISTMICLIPISPQFVKQKDDDDSNSSFHVDCVGLRKYALLCNSARFYQWGSKHNFAQKQEAKIQQQNDRLVICVYVTEPI